jgi:uncharacterized BrkB/YihY/UPF0761 family membrane protein
MQTAHDRLALGFERLKNVRALSEIWKLLRDTVLSFIEDEALSRGAAIAFYTVTSIAPVLLIIIAIAGLAFGRDAAQNAIIAQLRGLMGTQTAEYCKARSQVPRVHHRASLPQSSEQLR